MNLRTMRLTVFSLALVTPGVSGGPALGDERAKAQPRVLTGSERQSPDSVGGGDPPLDRAPAGHVPVVSPPSEPPPPLAGGATRGTTLPSGRLSAEETRAIQVERLVGLEELLASLQGPATGKATAERQEIEASLLALREWAKMERVTERERQSRKQELAARREGAKQRLRRP
jgi:hypothetical protein